MNKSDIVKIRTSKVAEKGRTRNPSKRSATAKLAIRMWVGPRRFELNRTAARMSKFPPMVKRTMTDKAAATIIEGQSIINAVAAVGLADGGDSTSVINKARSDDDL